MISDVSTNPKFNSCGTSGGDCSFLLSHGLGTSRAHLCHREYATPENGSEAQVQCCVLGRPCPRQAFPPSVAVLAALVHLLDLVWLLSTNKVINPKPRSRRPF